MYCCVHHCKTIVRNLHFTSMSLASHSWQREPNGDSKQTYVKACYVVTTVDKKCLSEKKKKKYWLISVCVKKYKYINKTFFQGLSQRRAHTRELVHSVSNCSTSGTVNALYKSVLMFRKELILGAVLNTFNSFKVGYIQMYTL